MLKQGDEAGLLYEVSTSERVQDGIKLIRDLYEDSKYLQSTQIDNYDQKIKIFENIRPELFRLMEQPATFFPVLELCVQAEETYNQLRSREKYFIDTDAYNMHNESLFMLSYAIYFLENEQTHKFEYTSHQAFLVTKALNICIHAPDASRIDGAYIFFQNHKDELISPQNALDDTKSILQNIEEYILTDDFIINTANAIDNDFRYTSGKRIRYCKSIIDKFLLEKKLNPDKLEASWLSRDKKEGRLSIEENILQIIELEKVKPGVTSFLYKEYGIRNFDRYPRDILIDQFENHNKNDLPYGVLIFASRDWSGAFSQSEIRRFDGDSIKPSMLEDFYQQIRGKYYFRVFECDGKYTLVKNLYKLNERYGNKHKIDFALIKAHGNPEGFELNSESGYSIGNINKRDVEGVAVRRMADWFYEDATIIFGSCRTGVEGGIAEALSKGLRRKTIAPAINTAITKINVSWTETMKPIFDVVYNPDKTQSEGDVKREYISSLEK